MDSSRENNARVDHALREMLWVAAIWALMLCISVGTCVTWGYHRTADSLQYYFGFPDWIFFSIILPWGASTVISIWFALCYMQDDPEEGTAEANEQGADA